jgi:nucleotide-binding universal stress UspA family protein
MEFSHILVSVNGNKVDSEIVRLACRLAKKSKGKVYADYVIEVERSLPLDTAPEGEIKKGEQVLKRAKLIAEEQDYKVETELLYAREAGPAIVDVAIASNIDLIIIGIGDTKQFGELSLGRKAPYVLKNAPCAVLVYREPVPVEAATGSQIRS